MASLDASANARGVDLNEPSNDLAKAIKGTSQLLEEIICPLYDAAREHCYMIVDQIHSYEFDGKLRQ